MTQDHTRVFKFHATNSKGCYIIRPPRPCQKVSLEEQQRMLRAELERQAKMAEEAHVINDMLKVRRCRLTSA